MGHTITLIPGDGTGPEITKAVKVSGCTISASAKEKIEKAKGEVIVLVPRAIVKNPGAGGIVGTPKVVVPAKPKKATKPAKAGKAPKAKAGKDEKPAIKEAKPAKVEKPSKAVKEAKKEAKEKK